MITSVELHRVAEEEGLRFDQAEKDYVILWVLWGLVHSGVAKHGWVFKGGTCLRHCYYEGYRFSEDIDFSCSLEAIILTHHLSCCKRLLTRHKEKSPCSPNLRII